MSLQEAISRESQVKDFIKVAPPSPEEVDRRRQVAATLDAFRQRLGNITNVAMNVQKQGESLDQITSLFKRAPLSPSTVKSQSDGEDYGDMSGTNPSPERNLRQE